MNKQYHYSDGTSSFGPFTLEELQQKQIGPDTLIWTPEFITWKKAKEIPELTFLLKNTGEQAPPFLHGSTNEPPPTYHQTAYAQNPNYARPPKTYLIESILTTIFCCWPVGIPSIIYAARVEKKFYAGDIAGAEADSALAKRWMLINIGLSVLGWIIGVIFYFSIFMFSTSTFSNGF